MKRPVGVWLVSLWCAFTVLVGAFGLYALAMKLPGTQTRLFASFGTVDYAASVLYHLSIGLAGLLLFGLRRSALWFFIAAVAFKAVLDVRQFSAAMQPGKILIALGASWLILLVALLYAANLARKGTLA